MPSDWEPVDPPQPLTTWQRAVIGRLAPGCRGAALTALRVTDSCRCGCSSVGLSPVEAWPAAEAHGDDTDGFDVLVMLFANREQTQLSTLDVLRLDGEPIKRLPPPESLTVDYTSS